MGEGASGGAGGAGHGGNGSGGVGGAGLGAGAGAHAASHHSLGAMRPGLASSSTATAPSHGASAMSLRSTHSHSHAPAPGARATLKSSTESLKDLVLAPPDDKEAVWPAGGWKLVVRGELHCFRPLKFAPRQLRSHITLVDPRQVRMGSVGHAAVAAQACRRFIVLAGVDKDTDRRKDMGDAALEVRMYACMPQPVCVCVCAPWHSVVQPECMPCRHAITGSDAVHCGTAMQQGTVAASGPVV